MATIISIVNQKGGVGKSTSAYNISSVIAKQGYKVLMIDMDPQASLTISCGFEPEECEKTIVDVMLKFVGNEKAKISETILEVSENLFLVPSIIDLAASDTLLLQEMGRERILKKKLEEVEDYFDFIFCDCPPSLNQLFINSLVASKYVLIPVSCDYLSYRGLMMLDDTIGTVQDNLNEDLEVMGVIATFHNTTIHARENLDNLREKYKIIGVVDTTVRAKDALYTGRALVDAYPENKVAEQYKKIAEEVMTWQTKEQA